MLPRVAGVSPELRRILTTGFEPVLLPAGFERNGQSRWRRSTGQLDHVVELWRRYGRCHVQWGVVSPELVWLLYGYEPRGDVSDAAMTGWPSAIRRPARAESFELDDGTDADAIALGVAEDMRLVEAYLRKFQTRADLREYLLLNRDPKDNRGFSIPVHLPLKLYTAAALAVFDRA